MGHTRAGGDGLNLLRIATDVREDGVWLVLEGEFDIAGVAAVERTLAGIEADSARPLVIDLGRLSFLDSSAVRTIVSASERARGAGRQFAIATGGGPAERLFRVLGLERRLRIVERPASGSR